MTEDSTATESTAPLMLRDTLMDAHRRRGGSPAMREAGRLLCEFGMTARLMLRCGPRVAADAVRVDRHLETAGLSDDIGVLV